MKDISNSDIYPKITGSVVIFAQSKIKNLNLPAMQTSNSYVRSSSKISSGVSVSVAGPLPNKAPEVFSQGVFRFPGVTSAATSVWHPKRVAWSK